MSQHTSVVDLLHGMRVSQSDWTNFVIKVDSLTIPRDTFRGLINY